jgi:serine/threonine protein kinase
MREFERPDFNDEDVALALGSDLISGPLIGQGAYKVAYPSGRNQDQVLKIVYRYASDLGASVVSDLNLPDRVSREIESLTDIRSAHVVKILRPPFSVAIGRYSYLAYIESSCSGGSLRDEMDLGPIPVERAGHILMGILAGIHALWCHGEIVHRDIKPENIMFDSDGEAVLIDLGIAMHGSLSPLTDTGTTSPKTPRYAAPEQFLLRRDAHFDARTDMYSAGIIAFEMLTGEHPFYVPGIDIADYLISQESFSAQDSRLDHVSTPLANFVAKLLEVEKYRRYRTPAIAQSALSGAL